MQFDFSDASALQPNHGNTLKLTPSTVSILLPKPHDISDFPTCGNMLDLFNFANYIKIHEKIHIESILDNETLRRTLTTGPIAHL